ncbi:MAG: hypothetical protein AAFY20_10585 [Cyanobacteria bacterium J06639_14]
MKLKQRIYLPAEYAEILSQKASEAGVSEDLFVQTMIANLHLYGECAGRRFAQPASEPGDDGAVTLPDTWTGLSL